MRSDKKIKAVSKSNKTAVVDSWAFFRIYIYFLIGNIIGCAVCSIIFNVPESAEILSNKLKPELIPVLLISVHFFVGFASSSYLGWLIIPVLICSSGFITAIASATIICNHQSNGIIISLIAFGISILSVYPILFVSAQNSVALSKKLIRAVCTTDASKDAVVSQIRLFLITLPILLAGVFLQCKLIPLLISHLS